MRSTGMWRLTAAIFAMALGSAAQAAFPEGPVKLVVPYAAGGGTDGVARALAAVMTQELGQPVIVENRTGAGAIVGTQSVLGAPADGYTMLIATNGNMVLTPLLHKALKYDARKDFRVLSVMVEAPSVAVVGPAVPATSLREFEAFVKSKPVGSVMYANLGQGNVLNIATKVMESMMGVQMTGVSYKGSSPSLTALIAGEVQLYVDLASTSLPMIRSGRIKALAVPNNKRLEALPEVPTFAEAGYAPFHAVSWLGVAVTRGVPEDRARMLQAAVRKAVADPKFRETARTLGMVLLPDMDETAVSNYLASDWSLWEGLAKRYDIRIDP